MDFYSPLINANFLSVPDLLPEGDQFEDYKITRSWWDIAEAPVACQLTEMTVFLRGWLPPTGKAQMALNSML